MSFVVVLVYMKLVFRFTTHIRAMKNNMNIRIINSESVGPFEDTWFVVLPILHCIFDVFILVNFRWLGKVRGKAVTGRK